MATGAGSGYLGNGAPRIEATARINAKIARSYLQNKRDDARTGGEALFRAAQDEEGDILRYEWLLTCKEMEYMGDDSDDHNAALVISSLNGLGAESNRLFPKDTKMAMEHFLSKYKVLGIAHNTCHYLPENMTNTEEDGVNCVKAGLVSVPAFRKLPLGAQFTLVPLSPMDEGEDQEYLPGLMPKTKTILAVMPLTDEDGESASHIFSRAFKRNMRYFLGNEAHYRSAFNPDRSLHNAGRHWALASFVNFLTFSTYMGVWSLEKGASPEEKDAIDTVLNMLKNKTGVHMADPSDGQKKARRNIARKVCLPGIGQILSEDAIGYNADTGTNDWSDTRNGIRGGDGDQFILKQQLNAHVELASAMGYLQRELNPSYGTIVKSADTGGVGEVLLHLPS